MLWVLAGLTLGLLPPPSSAAAASAGWSRIDDSPGFTGWRRELRRLVKTEGVRGANRFCVVVETFNSPVGEADIGPPATQTVARVIWREKHLLLSWRASAGRRADFEAGANDRLDLLKDVVPRQRDVGSSTYLVTRAWVRNITRRCETGGTQVGVSRP